MDVSGSRSKGGSARTASGDGRGCGPAPRRPRGRRPRACSVTGAPLDTGSFFGTGLTSCAGTDACTGLAWGASHSGSTSCSGARPPGTRSGSPCSGDTLAGLATGGGRRSHAICRVIGRQASSVTPGIHRPAAISATPSPARARQHWPHGRTPRKNGHSNQGPHDASQHCCLPTSPSPPLPRSRHQTSNIGVQDG